MGATVEALSSMTSPGLVEKIGALRLSKEVSRLFTDLDEPPVDVRRKDGADDCFNIAPMGDSPSMTAVWALSALRNAAEEDSPP